MGLKLIILGTKKWLLRGITISCVCFHVVFLINKWWKKCYNHFITVVRISGSAMYCRQSEFPAFWLHSQTSVRPRSIRCISWNLGSWSRGELTLSWSSCGCSQDTDELRWWADGDLLPWGTRIFGYLISFFAKPLHACSPSCRLLVWLTMRKGHLNCF